MSTTPHPFAPEQIMAHLDGELSPSSAQTVSKHLETCAQCQELVGSLSNASRSLSDWMIGPVPAHMDNNVAKLALQPTSSGVYGFPHVHGWTRKQRIGGLTIAIVASVFLFSISLPTQHRYKWAAEKASVLSHLREKKAVVTNAQSVDFGRVNSEQEQQDARRSFMNMNDSLPSSVAMLPPKAKNPASGLTLPAPMIARTVSLAIITKDFESSRGSLDSILVRRNGYAASLSVATPQDAARSLQASLRIPASQLATAILELRALGRVENESQNGDEVTQQHTDLLARLKNSRETEQRLQAILTQRTGKISDVLEVEQEIARVRGEIEQMEAEQKNLEHRVDFATIDLKLSEEYKAKLDSPAPAISTLIHNAAVNGYRNIADTLLSIVLFFAEYGPVLCFWLIVFFIPGWLVWRRWRHATAAV